MHNRMSPWSVLISGLPGGRPASRATFSMTVSSTPFHSSPITGANVQQPRTSEAKTATASIARRFFMTSLPRRIGPAAADGATRDGGKARTDTPRR